MLFWIGLALGGELLHPDHHVYGGHASPPRPMLALTVAHGARLEVVKHWRTEEVIFHEPSGDWTTLGVGHHAPDVPAIVLLDVPGLTPGPVVQVAYAEPRIGDGVRRPLDPEHPLDLEALVVRVAPEDPGDCAVQHRIEVTDGTRVQALFDHCGEDADPVGVIWAGDLDRDGRMDVLLDTSTSDYDFTLQLWLSGAASDEELLGKAAEMSMGLGC